MLPIIIDHHIEYHTMIINMHNSQIVPDMIGKYILYDLTTVMFLLIHVHVSETSRRVWFKHVHFAIKLSTRNMKSCCVREPFQHFTGFAAFSRSVASAKRTKCASEPPWIPTSTIDPGRPHIARSDVIQCLSQGSGANGHKAMGQEATLATIDSWNG